MANALARSSSPYLRQHADNPVDWVEWSPAAFAEAKRRNVPVLVSIGYATCHWCHVMAHESFEHPATAALMNDLFVNIKVDREELPEVDEIYMDAVQALHGHGGWPLNAFVDHEGRPFFAGTYFPRDRWIDLCNYLTQLWKEDATRVADSARELAKHLANFSVARPTSVAPGIPERARAEVERTFDPEHPGFGNAPKFPPSQWLVYALSHGDAETRTVAIAILEAMQDSGLHDRVGGGFHRYSTDRTWRVPHFEKMLYDNAQLAVAYALAAVAAQRPDFQRTALAIGDYLLRDLRVSDGDGNFLGYASAEDADDPAGPVSPSAAVGTGAVSPSAAVGTGAVSPTAAVGTGAVSPTAAVGTGEGSFYAWSPESLAAVLGDTPAKLLTTAWDVAPGVPHRGPSGHMEPVTSHIPHPRTNDLEALAKSLGYADAIGLRASWDIHYAPLRIARNARPRPIRDDKVLTDLNGLALSAFAVLARLFDASRAYDAAVELAEVLRARVTASGLERLPGRPAFITDYGHLALGLIDAHRTLGDPELIALAEAVIAEANTRLGAPPEEGGGFYTTPAGRSDLIRRSREHHDGPYPAGQHALALAAVQLFALTANDAYRVLADSVFTVQARMLERAPLACPTLLHALALAQATPISVVVTGSGPLADALLTHARALPRPLTILPTARHEALPWPLLEARTDLPTQALVCVGTHCLLPAFTIAELDERLGAIA